MKELLAIIAARQAAPASPFALATVVGVAGSSYRRPGARMLIGKAGRAAGSVSGGCLEEDVIAHGQEVMASGLRQVVRYDTANEEDRTFGSGLGCNGQIEILIEFLPPATPWPLADTVARVVATREAAHLITVVHGEQIDDVEVNADPGTYPRRQILERPHGAADVFIERIAPAPALVVFGGGPDVTPLIRIAREMGYHIVVIDRRRAAAATFPEADEFLCERPHQMAEKISFGAGCAVVIMNHHYETDRDALELVLPRRPAYVGMLGPRNRTDRILDEIAKRGTTFTGGELARLHAPAGLDLGSETPEQIALSILAEMQASLSGRSAGKLRSRSAPINAR